MQKNIVLVFSLIVATGLRAGDWEEKSAQNKTV